MSLTEVDQLFRRYYAKTASPAEVEALMVWIADPANEAALTRLMQEGWEGLEAGETLLPADKSRAILENLLAGRRGKVTPMLRPWPRIVAAAIGLVLCAGIYLLARRQPVSATTAPVAQHDAKKDVLPGGKKAILTLANGSTLSLDSAGNGLLAQQGATVVDKTAQGQLTYKTNAADKAVGYNTVATPRGGEYQVVLPDGSKVWLNAASSLRFPTAFTGSSRQVQLTGEAYFEIAPDKNKPFHVQVDNMTVQVLGTHFDVMAYDDEPIVKTSLLEGSVKVSEGAAAVVLSPQQGASLDRHNGRLAAAPTNVDKDVAWKEGNFDFENDDIRTIVRQLARWYDLKVVFNGNFDDQSYTGGIRRQVPVSQVLDMLKLAGGMDYSIDGNTITINRM